MNEQLPFTHQTNPRTYAQALSCLVAGLHTVGQAADPLNTPSPGGLIQPNSELVYLCIEDSFAKEIATMPLDLVEPFKQDLEFKLTRDALTLLNPSEPDFSFRLESLSARLRTTGYGLFIKKPDGSLLEWFAQIEVLQHQRLVVKKI